MRYEIAKNNNCVTGWIRFMFENDDLKPIFFKTLNSDGYSVDEGSRDNFYIQIEDLDKLYEMIPEIKKELELEKL